MGLKCNGVINPKINWVLTICVPGPGGALKQVSVYVPIESDDRPFAVGRGSKVCQIPEMFVIWDVIYKAART